MFPWGQTKEKVLRSEAASGADKPQRVALPVRLERLARAASDRQRALGEPLEVQVNAVDLPEPAASVAERMVREGLSNIVRHAGAQALEPVALLAGDAAAVVKDVDGCGRAQLIHRDHRLRCARVAHDVA